jgi:hypothetical protein
MRNLVILLVLGVAVSLLSGCVMPQTPVYGGLVTMDVAGPVAVGDPSVDCTKEGRAEATGIIFFSQGDASISAAMKAGGITKIHHVDCKTFSVLGLFAKYETIVYGE